MTVFDDKGRAHPDVGTGAKDHWARRPTVYPGCSCPAWRYTPRKRRPTNPECRTHGKPETADNQ